MLAKNDKGKLTAAGNKEGAAQLLLAQPLIDAKSKRAASYETLTNVILGDQQADGSWKPGGQLPSQKRPLAETADVSTMWLALALASQDAEGPPRAALDKALKHIATSPPGKSVEWYAVRLLLATRRRDQVTMTAMSEKLRAAQQSDGGWGWLIDEPSDALGTGLAVYALLQSGVARDDEAIRCGQRFLIDTQRDDGAWDVHGTKANKRKAVQETAAYWGAAWATLALCESLPE